MEGRPFLVPSHPPEAALNYGNKPSSCQDNTACEELDLNLNWPAPGTCERLCHPCGTASRGDPLNPRFSMRHPPTPVRLAQGLSWDAPNDLGFGKNCVFRQGEKGLLGY